MLASLRGAYVLSRLRSLIMHIEQQASARFDTSSSGTWSVLKRNRALGDREVLWLGRTDEEPTVVCHIPMSQPAILHYQHHQEICARLWQNEALGEWRKVLPRVLYQGFYENHPYWLEAPLPGIPASRVIQQDERRESVLRAVTEAILHLHQCTSCVVTFDERLFEKWVRGPLQAIRESTLPLYYPQSPKTLSKIEQRLAAQLLGKPITISWIHGDYWPENILVTPDGACATGIVDWELSQPDGLPLLDLVNLLLSMYRSLEAKELGHIIVELLEQGEWPPTEREICNEARQRLGTNFPAMQDVLILFWLQHTSARILTTSQLLINPFWARANYVDVLKYLEKLYSG